MRDPVSVFTPDQRIFKPLIENEERESAKNKETLEMESASLAPRQLVQLFDLFMVEETEVVPLLGSAVQGYKISHLEKKGFRTVKSGCWREEKI